MAAEAVQLVSWGRFGYITSLVTDNLSFIQWSTIFRRIYETLRSMGLPLADWIWNRMCDVYSFADPSLIITTVNRMIQVVKEVVPQLY